MERAVRHVPFTLTLEPSPRSGMTVLARIRMVRKSRELSTLRISPVSSMIPVNITANHQIGACVAPDHVFQLKDIGQTLKSFAADSRNFAPAKDRRSDECFYFINQ